MRKVKSHIVNTNDPAVLFARGVESLIADPMMHPSRHDDDELSRSRRVTHKQDSNGNLFNLLFRQFSNL